MENHIQRTDSEYIHIDFSYHTLECFIDIFEKLITDLQTVLQSPDFYIFFTTFEL